MQTYSDFVQSIAEAARTLNQPRSLDETLQTIVEVACNSVPGFDQVGIATLQQGKGGDPSLYRRPGSAPRRDPVRPA